MTTDWNILEILAFAALLIVAARWLIALLNLLTGEPRPATGEKTTSEISVLVPARNEAVDLPKLLHSLQRCDQTIGEIIIYDDQSDDHTAGVARYWAEYDRRIRVIEGSELPDGWRGKNHACHQLAMAAMGKYLLFLDADVKVGQKAIDLALSRMKKDHLALFSFFPVQEMHTTGEWLLVAQVNVILVSLLPLSFSRYIPFNLVTAANGQFMMFDAGVYDQQRFHEKLRTTVVEDVAIAQYIKGKGLKIRTALSPAGLSCRMYHNYRETLNGLGRSARFFFGGSIIAGWLYVFFALFGWLAVLLAFPMIWLAVYFLLLVTMRIFVAIASRQSVMKNILLMPLQPITLFHLFFTATRQHVQQKSTWKGRPL